MSTYKDIRTRFEMAMNEKLTVWKKTSKEAYFNLFSEKQGGRWIEQKSNEIIRAYFPGDDPELEIEKFLELNGIKASYYGDILEPSNKSGSFDSWKITLNTNCNWFGKELKAGEVWHIVNARKRSGNTMAVIGDKDSTPKKLGITDIQFPSKKSAIEATKEAIKNKIHHEDYIKFMLELVDVIDNHDVRKFTSVDDVITKESTYIIEHDFSEYFGIIDSISIKTIAKDFGEVLGGIFMFNLIKNQGAGLIFPDASNEAVVDFRFDKLDVSSKAGKKGAKASASGYLKKINAAIQFKNWKLDKNEENFINNFSKIILSKSNEANNTRYYKRSRQSGTFSQMVTLLNHHKIKSWYYWAKESGMSTQNIGRDDIVQSFIDLKEQGKLYKTLKTFSKKVGNLKGNARSTSSAPAKMTQKLHNARNEKECANIIDEILNIDKPNFYDVLVGTVLYGASKELVPVLNAKYNETLDSLINMAFSAKQLYLAMNIKKGSLKFTMKSMETANFQIDGLNGADSWDIRGLAISMK